MLIFTYSTLSVAATKFNSDLNKNALQVDLSLPEQYFPSSKEVTHQRQLGTEMFKSNGEKFVKTTSAHQGYILGPNDNDKPAFRTTTERKHESFRSKIVKVSQFKYPVHILHLKRKKKRRNKTPQLEDPVNVVDRFSGGCWFGEISVGGMCVHNDGFF